VLCCERRVLSRKITVFETVVKLVLVTKLSQGNRILNLQQ
jgi:hypothetical protein